MQIVVSKGSTNFGRGVESLFLVKMLHIEYSTFVSYMQYLSIQKLFFIIIYCKKYLKVLYYIQMFHITH